MTAIGTLPVVLGTGVHGSRPAASAVGSGGLYSCTTHSLVYQTDGSSWTTWATLSTGVSDYVSGASGSGQIIIPAMAGDADIRVAATNDDEFDTTDTSDPMTGWTSLGTPSAHDINSTQKSRYYLKSNANASVGLMGIYKAIPSTPFTVTCKLDDVVLRGDFMAAGLAVMEASPGKIESGWLQHETNPDRVAVQSWTNRTTYSSTPVASFTVNRGPIYLRCVVTTTTSVGWYWSTTGVLWRQLNTGHNPGFTVGAVGLVGHSFNGTYAMEALFDWIRFT